MDIGIIGSGTVGRTLGKGFIDHGHPVRLGTRTPERDDLRQWASDTGGTVTSNADAAAFGDVLVLATNWDGTEQAIQLAGPDHFAGKLVLDATNPLDFSSGPPPKLAVDGTDSAGERIQRWLPDAQVVKCFNIVGAPFMVDPEIPGGPPTMFIAGDSDEAKAQAWAILDDFGWETVDIGGIEGSRYLEAMAMAWILHGFRSGTWSHAFKLLRA